MMPNDAQGKLARLEGRYLDGLQNMDDEEWDAKELLDYVFTDINAMRRAERQLKYDVLDDDEKERLERFAQLIREAFPDYEELHEARDLAPGFTDLTENVMTAREDELDKIAAMRSSAPSLWTPGSIFPGVQRLDADNPLVNAYKTAYHGARIGTIPSDDFYSNLLPAEKNTMIDDRGEAIGPAVFLTRDRGLLEAIVSRDPYGSRQKGENYGIVYQAELRPDRPALVGNDFETDDVKTLDKLGRISQYDAVRAAGADMALAPPPSGDMWHYSDMDSKEAIVFDPSKIALRRAGKLAVNDSGAREPKIIPAVSYLRRPRPKGRTRRERATLKSMIADSAPMGISRGGP